jgi:protein-S-isoprenylcysteine O-methyltransferase Ste14
MFSLFLRNLLFTILQPGLIAGLFPFLVLGGSSIRDTIHQTYDFIKISGLLALLIGFTIMMICIINFATRGQGTLSPADPTKKLVINGLYKCSRNPMYVGVLLMLIGEALFFRSTSLAIYSACIFALFNTFIIFFEEPRLKKDFSEDYAKYCNQVGRWI